MNFNKKSSYLYRVLLKLLKNSFIFCKYKLIDCSILCVAYPIKIYNFLSITLAGHYTTYFTIGDSFLVAFNL
jgi:hypothetical protein